MKLLLFLYSFYSYCHITAFFSVSFMRFFDLFFVICLIKYINVFIVSVIPNKQICIT